MATQKKKTLEEFLSFMKPQEEVTIPFRPEQSDEPEVKKALAEEKAKNKASEIEGGPIHVAGFVKGVTEMEQEKPKSKLRELLPPPEPKAPAAPVAPAPVAKEPTIEPPQGGPNVWERLLIGATPALVGLLSGNKLEGVQIAGKTLVDNEADLYKREKDFNTKIAEMKAKRALASNTTKPNYAREVLINPADGKAYVHSLVNNQDQGPIGLAPSNKTSWSKTELVNPETGKLEVAFIDPQSQNVQFYGQGKTPGAKYILSDKLDKNGKPQLIAMNSSDPTDIQYLGDAFQKPNAQVDREKGINDRFAKMREQDAVKMVMNPNSIFNKSKAEAESLVRAADLLNKNNPIANQNVKVYIARLFQSGVLSDQDIAAMQGSGALQDQAARLMEKYASGDFEDGDANDLRQIIETLHPYIKQRGMAEVENISKAHDREYPGVRKRLQEYATFGNGEKLPSYIRQKAGARVGEPKANPISAGLIVNGMRFKGGDRKDPKNWEKVK